MKRRKTLLILALTSCVETFHLTDNAYYDIDDTSIRLVIQHPDASLHLTNYEKTYILPGHYCKKLETTDQLDTIYKTGIAIRFWTQIGCCCL
jgi:hypothetical protein